MGYLILDLAARGAADVHRFLRGIEADLVAAIRELGVAAHALPGRTGVFAAAAASRPRKLASIGVGLRGWISFHGFALKVAGSGGLQPDRSVRSRGRGDRQRGRELGGDPPPDLMERARAAVAAAFAAHWDAT